ncbi:hypothetical protein [Phaeocystidibacter marisrubri]|uniref:tRNA_anti-like n=1 Tax=Phaeocystidibacter marisrubri TaxID=1577780 RepID=A0A6L3ZGQ7_9FLAO|nr:hypothetical protein [Phaeocystidibacter marisrubri]KAB2817206.1 hypothetical protein F8C82_02105 [Phaeocystidibacter marisrubri]GGH76426.1 hypothetical protein GCM10011318_24670 [Phaeocystidibacter marisrubri]
MTQKKKAVLLVFIGVIIIGVAVGSMMYFKPHRDIHSEDAVYSGYAHDFFSEFESDSTAFKASYEDQPVVITGEVTFMEQRSFELDGSINCYLDSTVVIPDSLQRGMKVTVKARYVGFKIDDLFGTTILDIDQARFQ